ncbi:MAG: Nif3-like dinuclear metal center hexameric protein [Phycisphaerae bacterium]|nr:Nif3-like dinuclear metal center hexameric protein [Phycisphaerae bacterium]
MKRPTPKRLRSTTPRRTRGKAAATVADVESAMDRIAPPSLAQDWDNVGLLVGDRAARVQRAMLCIDLTPAVVDEAVKSQADFLMTYHPPLFRPVKRLIMSDGDMESLVLRCIQAGIAIYAPHTALDAAEGGTNDALSNLCGLAHAEPLEFASPPPGTLFKLITFVPADHLDRVADGLFEAGAGHIGGYSHCSYRLAGQGTFLGGESTNPTVGKRGKLEQVDEMRIEVVVPQKSLPKVCAALRSAHPYEEPAFDLYPLQAPPVQGIGRVGMFPGPVTLEALAAKLRRSTKTANVQLVGDPKRTIYRAVIVAGAAGSLPLKAQLGRDDVIITGEIRHHDALTFSRLGCTAIALGHWASERPVLASLRDRLANALPHVDVAISESDTDPFRPL